MDDEFEPVRKVVRIPGRVRPEILGRVLGKCGEGRLWVAIVIVDDETTARSDRVIERLDRCLGLGHVTELARRSDKVELFVGGEVGQDRGLELDIGVPALVGGDGSGQSLVRQHVADTRRIRMALSNGKH